MRQALNPHEVVQRIDNLIQLDQVRITEIFSDDDVHQLGDELKIKFRERELTPAITLGLFVSQCLSRGDACSTVLTKFNRERTRRGQSPCSEDASAYCKARAKLTVERVDRLGERIVNDSTAAMKGKLTGEVSLFREKHGDFVAGDIVVADSNFESFYDSVRLNRRGVELVCRIKGCRNSPLEDVCEVLEEKTPSVSALTKSRNSMV